MRRFTFAALTVFSALALAVPAGAQPLGDPRDVPPDQCPLQGSARSEKGQALNQLKNREAAPRPEELDPNVTLDAMLAPGDDQGRFDESKGATITGWVVDVKQGGHPETANCGSMSLLYTDTHITVGLTAGAPETETIVVEVTPRWRQRMLGQGIDWTTGELQHDLIGKKIQFTGWLMFDTDHVHQAVNTAPGNPRDWRKTVWEIHPITDMQPAPPLP